MNKRTHNYGLFQWIDIENPSELSLSNLDLPLKVDLNFLEDALESGHLPKIEKTSDYTFMILRAYTASEDEKAIEVGQISNKIAFFVNEQAIITIHRAPFSFLNNLPENFKSSDEMVLYIINELLNTFEKPIKTQSERMDALEQSIFLKAGDNLSIEKLYFEKSKARLTKKILVIMQSVFNHFKVKESLHTNLQDVKDTILDLTLRTEEVVEDANSLLNSYMSFQAKKSNDVMKLLTVFPAFFLPLTFIAGLYGMNFENMPELRTDYGYFITLLFMLIIAIGIFIWFRRKK
ncbi:CorA family divalent cation transporter [Marivirga sp.]|uniref:CorA family divalent cation transporter n=1 Tax=Marivirga sp. TaxID=2018662 RepID=UPI002D7FC288|nr:CorA family divalent cation transporter [Marivirga sp.]HET8861217.1 CorA family divalent cation transporter [Marivirga sp.]